MEIEREEDNVCILDIAEYSLDGSKYETEEEVLRIDDKLRTVLNWPKADGMDTQPWAIKEEKITHFVNLKYTFDSEIEIDNVHFCCEELEELSLNGKNIKLVKDGYFVDKSIHRYVLPSMHYLR